MLTYYGQLARVQQVACQAWRSDDGFRCYIDGWQDELEKMNQGKVVGEPYHYPDSFVLLLGYMRAYFHLPYRQTEGVVVKAYARNVPPSIPYYSTLCRRVNKLDIKVNERIGNDIIIALDSTEVSR
jgi:hypothetical protein